MQTKLLKGLFHSLLGIAALCALGMVVATVVFLLGLTNLQVPSADRVSKKPLRTATPHHAMDHPTTAPAKTAPSSRRVETAKQSASQEELDRQFKQFLTERGLPTDDLQATLDVSVKAEPTDDDEADNSGLDPQTLRQLKEEYPLADARRKHEGEVWLRIDPSEAEGLAMDELMARAADLCGDSFTPIKVVVWVGNRPRAVRTFNGAPMF
jgi:hypothetical protein